VDGESLARLPVEFSIVPKALKLLVPRGKIGGTIVSSLKP
jgi:diacylglycerol kinase family enzyme